MSSRPTLIAAPGLFWPSPGLRARLAAQRLPGLQRLLAGARVCRGGARSFDAWLCALFGAGSEPDFAGLRLAGEDVNPPVSEGAWLCADPVSYTFAREQMLLRSLTPDEISLEEAQAMISALNAEFGELGQFFAATPTRWYLATPLPNNVHLPTLDDANGRPLAYFQPEGPDRAIWARALNELQVFCHHHPLNRAREARGAAPVNGLWLWGNGEPMALRAPCTRGCGDASPLMLGLCRGAGMDWRDAREFDPDFPLQFFTALAEPARRRDETAWLQALAVLDANVFVPLADALADRSLPTAQLVAPGDGTTLVLELNPLPRWRLWGRQRSMSELAAVLCPEDISVQVKT